MQIHKKTVIASGSALAIVGVSAFAYFTATGTISGSGTATVDNQAPTGNLVLSVANRDKAVDVSKDKAVTVYDVTAANSGNNHLSLPANTNVAVAAGATCPAGSFSAAFKPIANVSVPPATTEVPTTVVGNVEVTFNNSPTENQDGCLGDTLNFTFSQPAEVVEPPAPTVSEPANGETKDDDAAVSASATDQP